MDSNLARRIGFAAVAIPLALLIVWQGGFALAALVAVVSALGTRELFSFAERQGIRPAKAMGLVTAAAFGPLVYATLASPDVRELVGDAWPYAVAIWLIALLTWTLVRLAPGERPLAAAAVTLLAVAYAGALPAFIVDLRHSSYPERSAAGMWLVFFPLVVTWVCDTAAMFGGRAMGGPKLAPTVSPGKTRSGSIAGVVGGLVVAPIFYFAIFPSVGIELSLGQLLLVALVLSVIGQVGDLAESLLKREVGVKDSSSIIPGHGGVLDRFDSLYFVMPIAAALFRFFKVS